MTSNAATVVAAGDLIGVGNAAQQMYAEHIKYLAEWLLNPLSTDGSSISTVSYDILLSEVNALRTQEGITTDSRVIYDGFILRGSPAKALEKIWNAYKDCSVLGLTELQRRRLSDGDPLPADFIVGSSSFSDEGGWW